MNNIKNVVVSNYIATLSIISYYAAGLNNTSPGPYETVGLWQALTAINQIQLAASGNLLISSSVFTLYGIGA